MIRLNTKRLLLREWREDDIEDLVEGLNDIHVSKWLVRVPHPYTQTDAANWIQFCSTTDKYDDVKTSYEFAVELRTEQKVIGGVTLSKINWDHESAGGGIWISKAYSGYGYGAEAYGERIRFAFEDLKLRRLENGFLSGNRLSWIMQKRLGYKIEGKRRKVYRCLADGMLKDEYITGLLREEWLRN